ncbi:MAG TPA: BON domain-containing protein, partial [Terriglobia bacterium]|nr:BON domain-containing protein [Terriglobia bacterium]
LALCCGLGVAAQDKDKESKDKKKDDKISTFYAYVDADVCARLMLGPISQPRIDCSKSAYKQGSNLVIVRMDDNTVFSVNKPKLVKDYLGGVGKATGEAKTKSGEMKLDTFMPEQLSDIPADSPAQKLIDVRNFKAKSTDGIFEKIRHELAMMAYITTFDFISFSMVGDDVILTGWTVRDTNRDDAYHRAKGVAGVKNVVNNIEILPLGNQDMAIRAAARGALEQQLGKYFWSNGSDIKIIVKNSNIILVGSVTTKEDSDIATIKTNSISGVFNVINLLRVEPPPAKNKG